MFGESVDAPLNAGLSSLELMSKCLTSTHNEDGEVIARNKPKKSKTEEPYSLSISPGDKKLINIHP